MRADLVLLTFAYVLSQFYRTVLAVLAQVLEADIGAGAEALATASGLWFLSFAVMQLPVGWALDRIGPRLTSSVLLLIGGGGGAAIFALAQGPGHVMAAMLLIGVGCSPVLMASYFIFAQVYPPKAFATLAAVILGVGLVGNLASALPTTLAVEAVGWRAVMWGLAAVSGASALGLFVMVRDPEKVVSETRGSLIDLLRMPALWLIFPLTFFHYAPSGALRGLWMGPYFTEVFGAGPDMVGNLTLVMGAAMIAGSFAFGPLDRVFGTRKWVIAGGNLATAMALLALGLLPAEGMWRAVALVAVVGCFGATYPVLMAHGRSFCPPHLVGRGVTLMNLFAIGGVGVMQMVTSRIYGAAGAAEQAGDYPFRVLFLVFAGTLAAGLVVYLFSEDRVGS